jgi:hypothetical protein
VKATDVRYRSDPQRVVHETIDGEVILIQLETGNYYSLGGSGAEVWALLQQGRSREEIAERLLSSFDAPPGQVEDAVERLTSKLVEEGLLERNGDAPGAPMESNGEVHERVQFVEPALEKYSDMQDFLLVDPIHEVGDAGWPNTRPAAG